MKPEDRPRIVTPVVAIVIEKPSQLADSLADHPIKIEFKVNQVSFPCELATALHHCITLHHVCCILATHVSECTVCHLGCGCGLAHMVHINPALCVYA